MDMVEVDLRRCRSGEIVLFHDESLEQITGHEGRVSETDWEMNRSLPIRDSDETVIRLDDAVGSIPSSVGFNLELKEPGLAAAIAPVVEGIDHQLLISSFLPESIAGAADCGLDADTGLLFEGNVTDNLDRAVELDCTHVYPHYELCLESDIVERAHRRELLVNAWTVTDGDTARALVENRVDGLILDRTGLI